ncbi:MAG: hypothetical protein U0T75_10810 [Chitinophagales bacterium]
MQGSQLKFSLLYAFGIFALGFVLGTIRTLVLVPRIGALAGVLIEIPIMLACAYFYSRWLIERQKVNATFGTLLSGGLLAFVILMCLEYSLGVFVFKQSPASFFSNMKTLPGALGLAAQVIFGFVPVIHTKPKML